MTTVVPEGDDVRKAVKWISELRQSGDTSNERYLVEQAAMKYNLSPKDTETLLRFMKEK